MYILKNPFHILSATPIDDRAKIMELADECSLKNDPIVSSEARANLINSKKRLSSEISWFPGIPQNVINALLLDFNTMNQKQMLISLATINKYSLNPISSTNFWVSYLFYLGTLDINIFSNIKTSYIIDVILKISKEFEDININDLCLCINKDRQQSKFTKLNDISLLEDMLNEHRQYVKTVFKDVLNKFKTQDLVASIKNMISTATSKGDKITPLLISDLLDFYEISAENFLEVEKHNINYFCQKLLNSVANSHSEKFLNLIFDIIYDICQNWFYVVEPLHIFTKSKGIKHDKSLDIFESIRNVSLEISNKYHNFEISLKLTKLNAVLFKYFDEVMSHLDNDIQLLSKMSKFNKK
jgi:hypothetical protein